MARGSKMITLTGPWLGIEERENYQTPKHCSIALNCDFTNGNIEARKGFKRIRGDRFDPPGALFTHLVKKNGKPKYIIAAGPRLCHRAQNNTAPLHPNRYALQHLYP